MPRILVETIGFIAGICTTLSFIPQVIKIVSTRKVRDISGSMYAVLGFGIFMWMVYGIFLGELPIIAANAVSLMFCVTILVFKIIYAKR